MDTDSPVQNIAVTYTEMDGQVHRLAHIVYGHVDNRMAKLIGLGLLFEQAWCAGEEKIVVSLNGAIVYESDDDL